MAFQTNEFENHKPQFSTFCGSCLHDRGLWSFDACVGCIVLGFSERAQEPVVCPFAFEGASDLWTTFLCCGGIKLSFLLVMSCKIQIPGLVHFVVHVFMEGVSEWGRITDWTDCFCEIGLPLYGLLLGRAPWDPDEYLLLMSELDDVKEDTNIQNPNSSSRLSVVEGVFRVCRVVCVVVFALLI